MTPSGLHAAMCVLKVHGNRKYIFIYVYCTILHLHTNRCTPESSSLTSFKWIFIYFPFAGRERLAVRRIQ